MAITYNAKGTSYPSFMIGKRGPTLYQTTLPESSEKGDIFIDTTNGLLLISNGTSWSTFLESDTAASTYLTKANPISTGEISFDSGHITSDGEGNLTLAGLIVPSIKTSAVVLTSGTMNITAPTLDFSNSGAVKSVTPAAGDSSTNVATTAFVENAIAGFSSDPLIGPTVAFGDKTKAVTTLELDFYQSGPPTSGTVTTDAQITVTSGVAGVKNNGTLTVNSTGINVNASRLVTTADQIQYTAPIMEYITSAIVFASPNTTQDGNGWGFIFLNSEKIMVSGIVAVNTETETKDEYRGGLCAIGTSFQFGDRSDSSAVAPYSLTFQTSANAGISDFTILASGGSATANSGSLTFTGSKIDLTGVGDVVSVTPVSTDNSTTVATTAYVQSNLASYAKETDLSSYLTKTDASTTYLTSDAASTTYLTKTDASTTYLTSEDATTTYLPLTGGTLSGELNSPTPTAGDSSTKVATTAFVTAAIAGSSKSGVNTYKVADLPSTTSASVGDLAFATDGCKPGEDTGTGTGTPVFYDGTSWINFGTFKTVTA